MNLPGRLARWTRESTHRLVVERRTYLELCEVGEVSELGDRLRVGEDPHVGVELSETRGARLRPADTRAGHIGIHRPLTSNTSRFYFVKMSNIIINFMLK